MSIELTVLLKVTAIFGVTTLAVLALRRASAATRHTVWGIGFLAALILPIGLATLPVIKLRLPLLAPASIEAGPAVSPRSVAEGTEVPGPPLPTGRVSPPLPSQTDAIAVPMATPPIHAEAWELRQLLRWIWGLGSLVAFLRLLFSHREVLRLKRLSTSACPKEMSVEIEALERELSVATPVDVRFGPHGVPPMACGVFRQMILLPPAAAQWTEERRRLVLAHELAHTGRRDGLIQAVVEIVCACIGSIQRFGLPPAGCGWSVSEPATMWC